MAATLYYDPVDDAVVLFPPEYDTLMVGEDTEPCCCNVICCCEVAPGPASIFLELTFTALGTTPPDACECYNQTALELTGSITACADPPDVQYESTNQFVCGQDTVYAVTCSSGGTWELHIGGAIEIQLTLVSCSPLHLTGSGSINANQCSASGTADYEVEVTE